MVIRIFAGWSFLNGLVRRQLREQQIRGVINNEVEQYMCPFPHLLSNLGITSASSYYYTTYLLLPVATYLDFDFHFPQILPHHPVDYTTTIHFRWLFSLSIHYGSTRTPIPYRCPSLSAEPVETIFKNLNRFSKPTVIAILRDSSATARNYVNRNRPFDQGRHTSGRRVCPESFFR